MKLQLVDINSQIIKEALSLWPLIRRTVADALVNAGIHTEYEQAFAVTSCWEEVHFAEGEEGRAIKISFDGGQWLGSVMVRFCDWRLENIEVDHTGDWFCPLSETFQQIHLLLSEEVAHDAVASPRTE